MSRFFLPFAFVACLLLSGCATAAIGGAVVGTAATATKLAVKGTVGVTKLAVKGTVGATKLAYKGTKAVVKGTSNMLSDDQADNVSPNLADDYRNLPDPE